MGAFEDYSSALADFKRVDAEIDAVAQSLAGVSANLTRNRPYFCFSNALGSFPLGVSGMPNSQTYNANDWKTGAQINEALSRWHSARDRVRSTWQSLSGDQQQALQPPPESILGRRR